MKHHFRRVLRAPLMKAGALALTLGFSGCGPDSNCDKSGYACNWAGVPGEVGFNGDGLPLRETQLYWSMDMIFAKDGTPWFIDWNNHLVRKVEKDGTVKTVVGWIDPVFPGDGAPDEREPGGTLGTNVQLNHPTDMIEADDGTIFLMAWHNHKLRTINPETSKVTIVGGAGAGFSGDNGPLNKALFKQPVSLERDPDGNLYISDQQNFRIRKVDTAGNVTTIAGDGTPGFAGDEGPALSAKFAFEAGSNPEPTGGLAYGHGKLYISDTLNNRIRELDLASGVIRTIAGTGEKGFAGDDGPALQAQFNHPRDLELGPEGDLYIADTDNSRIRALNLATGVVRTVAGTGELGLDEEHGKLATETKLKRPFGIAFDADGNLYICDTINSRILRVAK